MSEEWSARRKADGVEQGGVGEDGRTRTLRESRRRKVSRGRNKERSDREVSEERVSRVSDGEEEEESRSGGGGVEDEGM